MKCFALTTVHARRPAFVFLKAPLVLFVYSTFVFINGVNVLRADDGNAYISAGFTYLVGTVISIPTLVLTR